MGKRKSAKKPGAGRVKMAGLDKSFKCLFCQHNNTVTCKLDTKNKVARLDCKDCAQHFSTDINHLTEAIDVYSEWIDACTKANPEDDEDGPVNPAPRKRRAPAARDYDDDDDNADLPDMRIAKKKKEVSVQEDNDSEED